MVALILISSGTAALLQQALAAGQHPPAALTTPTINCSFTNSRNTRLTFQSITVPSHHQCLHLKSSGSYSARYTRINIRNIAAVRKEGENGWSNINNGSSVEGIKDWNPALEIQVPFEQRPVNEYSSLRDDALYSWGELSTGMFLLRLGGLWSVAFLVLGLPISAASFDPSRETLKFILAAGTGPLLLVSLILLRIYLGWSYVGDRLLSAVIPYEESGWYDGQMWVKPPEVLARDRLLGSYKVKPVINLVKQTLVAIGALLVTNVAIFIFADPIENNIQSIFATNAQDSSVTTTTKKTAIRKKDLLSLPAEVKEDDVLAAAAAEAADGRPSYCRNRLYRALAGGQYCKWEDLLGQ